MGPLNRLCRSSGDGDAFRVVKINCGFDHHGYGGNLTTTTKYNLVTFLPKALFEQYRRVANIYFTVAAALSLTTFSPVRPWTTWTPLAIVLGISLIKEAIEDYKRYKADKEMNSRVVHVLDHATGAFEQRRWLDVVVGDIVRIDRNEFIPADLLLLSSETEEGTCYIETMNLDGETNLKIKTALDQTKELTSDTVQGFRAEVHCEGPNAKLYQFSGNLVMHPAGMKEVTIPLSASMILLRGCSLRNTDHVFGAVIFAGHDTKVFQNATSPPSKRSSIEHVVDKIIILMFAVLFLMCLITAIVFAVWTRDKYPAHWYLRPSLEELQYQPSNAAVTAVISFLVAFVLYGYLIPISLYVSLEIVKVVQSMVFIAFDRDMYHADSDTPAMARTSNLNEDLGMVNTVLSDKTGTLTRNVMEFFKCSIAGTSYGAGITEIERSNAARHGKVLPSNDNPNAAKHRERFFNFYDNRMMEGAWTQSADAPSIELFLRLLAICHTVIPEGPADPTAIKYEAESPDEAALVVAAKALGFFFFKRTSTTVTVRETTSRGTHDVEYEVLNVIEFSSFRRRMSVIVRDSSRRIIMFCKGADSVIYELLDPDHGPNKQLKAATSAHTSEYGSAGLRTLCLSYTELDPDFYDDWNMRYVAAKTVLDSKEREEKLGDLAKQVECKLRLLGCTAIEDKLQEGVPQCIKKLAEAGIRLWVLTGDKMETAINIGYACSLITEEMRQFVVQVPDQEHEGEGARPDADKTQHGAPPPRTATRISAELEAAKQANEVVEEQLRAALHEVQAMGTVSSKEDGAEARSSGAVGPRPAVLVIDGNALQYALSGRLSSLFLEVGLRCQAVVCCRVSPLQKAQVTGLVKSHGDVTLAIGDGANDVGMIQQAHIGVGISGQEGMQAVMASDFAIAQFRFLTPLLLVHGRWSYKRIARMICFFFYKNLLFGVTIFAYNAFTNFSGQYIYNDVYMTLFNVIFTALTPIVIGIFDRDVDRELGLKYPALYRQGQKNTYFNFWAITGWLATSLLQCAIIMVLVLVGCYPTMIDREGGDPFTMYEVGVLMFSIIIVTVHFQVAMVEEQFTWIHHFSLWASTLIWWVFLICFNYFPLWLSADLYYLFIGVVGASPQYWLMVLLVPVACLLPDFFFRSVRRHIFPSEHQLVQEEQVKLMREGKRNKSGVALPTQPAGTSGLVLHLFDRSKQHNTGFVPPYDPQSRYYNFVATETTGKPSEALQPTSIRNPVLTHLDQEMTKVTGNPYREKRTSSMLASQPQSAGGDGINGTTVMSPPGVPGAILTGGSNVTVPLQQVENPLNTSQDAAIMATYVAAMR
eukprot:CAMPEP_0202922204 /NCGR_PEP_ID=MMETSP1392-20130828/77797_1 /ASSEMBLY_ACC=CAM_ASM_000868 /TAXON_ID=225041 /ORGANISM="Chlamydomonas chlamydogama, Strain SAG 11-48b" /LENGTH=1321 /DNA_ID=CAMNT_0049615821 /DNA_START=167 /DNA_END=4132 /DNA_ORIENTATION=-